MYLGILADNSRVKAFSKHNRDNTSSWHRACAGPSGYSQGSVAIQKHLWAPRGQKYLWVQACQIYLWVPQGQKRYFRVHQGKIYLWVQQRHSRTKMYLGAQQSQNHLWGYKGQKKPDTLTSRKPGKQLKYCGFLIRLSVCLNRWAKQYLRCKFSRL